MITVTEISGAILAAAGLWVLILERHTAATVKRVRNWPSTQGVVTVSKIERRIGSIFDHRAKIRYRYLVGGREYTGRRVSVVGDVSGGRTPVEERASSYSQGCPVTVYYNPQNPKEAYLEFERENQPLISLIGVASLIIGVAFATGIWPLV